MYLTPPHSPKHTEIERPRRGQKRAPSHRLNLYTDPKTNKKILKTKTSTLVLKSFADGEFHKVWEVEGKPGILIKTPHFKRRRQEIEQCSKDTKSAYDTLSKRTDLRVAKITTWIEDEGYSIVERVDGIPPLANIRPLLAKMITDPKQCYIEDFMPRNIRADSNGTVVVIDPTRNYNELSSQDDREEMALKIADYYRAWADENAKIYLKEDINVNVLLELSKDLFNRVDQRLSIVKGCS